MFQWIPILHERCNALFTIVYGYEHQFWAHLSDRLHLASLLLLHLRSFRICFDSLEFLFIMNASRCSLCCDSSELHVGMADEVYSSVGWSDRTTGTAECTHTHTHTKRSSKTRNKRMKKAKFCCNLPFERRSRLHIANMKHDNILS